MPGLVIPGQAREVIARALPLKRTASGLLLREANVGEMHGRDRNKPCPCKSGRKWKRCHGRP